ncbi:MAG: response regulator transcription factor [Acidobacteriota bacterium]
MTIKVLLLDDDRAFLTLSRKRLEAEGMTVFTAESWHEVTPILREEPDIALLDVHVPALDGDALADIVKGAHPDIVVLLMSSADEDELARRVSRSRADGYISKSASGAELVAAVRRHLRTSS